MASFAFDSIRFQDLLMTNIWKESGHVSYLHGDSLQGKLALEIITFWLAVGCYVSHPIRLKDSLVSNKTGKNQLHEDNRRRKVAFKITFLGFSNI